jgi:predicted permease
MFDSGLFLNVLFSILMLVAMIVPGFLLRKLRIVSKFSVSALVAILLYVTSPFLIVKAFLYDGSKGLNPTDGGFLLSLLYVFIISLAAQFLLFGVVKLCIGKMQPVERSRAYTYASVFGNVGFIGLPLVAAIIPDNPAALVYCAVFNVGFNMLTWTLGVYIFTGDKKAMRPLKILLNPTTVAFAIALPLFLCKVDFNLSNFGRKAATMVGYIGDMTAPLSMIIIGIRLADMKLKEVFADWREWVCCALKLLAAPALMFGLVMLLRLTGIFGEFEKYQNYGIIMIKVVILLFALPSGATTIAFSEKFHGDTQSALKGFMSSTLLSVITLPLTLGLLFSFL